MKRGILAFLLAISFLTSFSSVVLPSSALVTSFEVNISGEEYGVIGEKYILNLKFENFTEDEFLGATAYIDYDTSVLEIDSTYLSILNGTVSAENGASGETYPLINPEEGWVFWGKNEVDASSGTFMVNVLNDGDSITSLKGSCLECFVEFRVKEDANEGITVVKIDSDAELIGVFSETEIKSAYGKGSQLSFDILKEEPIKETELILKADSKLVMREDSLALCETLVGIKPKTTISEIFSQFDNTVDYLRIIKNGAVVEGDEFISTGAVLQLYINETVIDSVVIVCIGDIDSSSSIDTTDYLGIKGHLSNKTELSGAYLTAADVDGSLQIDTTDYIRLKMYFLGSYDIYA
jgi:hypothetical protein